MCVYLSVPALAASASVETSKQRYSRVSLRLFLDFDRKKPSVRKLWREKANMQMSWSSRQELLEGRLVGRMLLHRLAAGATGKRDQDS